MNREEVQNLTNNAKNLSQRGFRDICKRVGNGLKQESNFNYLTIPVKYRRNTSK